MGRHAFPVYKTYEMNECYILRGDISCKITNTQVALTVVMMSWSFLYFGLYLFYLLGAVGKLKTLPRQDHKMANLSVRLQACPPCSSCYRHCHLNMHACAWHHSVRHYHVSLSDVYIFDNVQPVGAAACAATGGCILHARYPSALVCTHQLLSLLHVHLVRPASAAGTLLSVRHWWSPHAFVVLEKFLQF